MSGASLTQIERFTLGYTRNISSSVRSSPMVTIMSSSASKPSSSSIALTASPLLTLMCRTSTAFFEINTPRGVCCSRPPSVSARTSAC